jgi:hypothetical protein
VAERDRGILLLYAFNASPSPAIFWQEHRRPWFPRCRASPISGVLPYLPNLLPPPPSCFLRCRSEPLGFLRHRASQSLALPSKQLRRPSTGSKSSRVAHQRALLRRALTARGPRSIALGKALPVPSRREKPAWEKAGIGRSRGGGGRVLGQRSGALL